MYSSLTYLFALCFMFPFFLFGQIEEKYAQSISESDISEIIQYLASDSLEGRDTGSPGLEKAKSYIVGKFEEYGLKPAVSTEEGEQFTQPFLLNTGVGVERGYIGSNGLEYKHLKEAMFIQSPSMDEPQSMDLVFVGKGEEEDYVDLEVEGKMVLIWGNSFSVLQKTETAKERGALGCVVVPSRNSSGFQSFVTRMGMFLSFSRAGLKAKTNSFIVIAVAPETAVSLLQTSAKKLQNIMGKNEQNSSNLNRRIKQTEIELRAEKSNSSVETANILGYVEGSEFPEEVIVVTAHYDHVGKKGEAIFNGADDNASGTTALMEVAEAFALAAQDGYRPKRSILFMPLAAEEKGLLGSEYYADYDPVFPLEKTVLNLNMDMVGHLDKAHDDPNFVCVIGSDWLSSELHEIHERANEEHVGLELDYTYNSKDHPERFYYRSDQYNFAKHNIPVIFYTSGDHEDYHKPSDTVEKIKTIRIQKVAQLVFHTAWEVANRVERIAVDRTVDD